METKELRDCNAERLGEIEKQLRRQIFDARMKNYTNQLDDTASIRRARRDLARVLTLIAESSSSEQAVERGSDSESESE